MFAIAVAGGSFKSHAYKKAYPRSRKWTSNSCRVRAHELSRNKEVMERIEYLREVTTCEQIMTQREAKIALSTLARARLSDFLTENGQIDLQKVKELEGRALELKITESLQGGSVSLKLNVLDAIRDLAKMEGWNEPEKVEVTGSLDVLLAEIDANVKKHKKRMNKETTND